MVSLRRFHSAISKFQKLVSECRRGVRQSSHELVEISWRDAEGRMTQGNGRCVDISDHGTRITYFNPIRLPAVVRVKFQRIGVVRTGRVVHCTQKDDQYEFGIEFCTAEELRRLLKLSPSSFKTEQAKFPRIVGGAPLEV